MSCKVSVIIPVCNVEKYLRQCLDSVCGQTLADIEIVCVDDKSDDDSLEILKEYQRKDSRFIILENETRLGAAESRNKGIKIARGEYLSILDADDYFELNMLELAYDCCEKGNADICGYDFWEFDDATGDMIRRSNQPIYYMMLEQNKLADEGTLINMAEMEDCFSVFYMGGAWQKLYKRKFITGNGVFFQSLPNANDAYFCAITLVLAQNIAYVHQPLVHYRINRIGQTVGKINKYPLSMYQVFVFLYHKLIAYGRYSKVKRAYNSIVVNLLIEIMRQMSAGMARQTLYQKIREDKFYSCGIDQIKDEFFLDYRTYWLAKKIFEVENADALQKVADDSAAYWRDRKVYCYKELKKTDLVCALWGYGQLGRQWLEEAQKLQYSVAVIIDQDKHKQGELVGNIKILDFADCPLDVEAVIITNSSYREEIVNTIRFNKRKIMVIDFDYFIKSNRFLDACIFT